MASELSIADIDGNIESAQNSLTQYLRSHSEYITTIYDLAEMRWERYQLSQEKDDLDRSIVHCTEAILLPPVSRDRHPDYINNVIHLLFQLAFALLKLSEKFEQPECVEYSIEYLRYLRRLPLHSFEVTRKDVTTLLIRALAIQVKSEDGDGTRNIEEIVVLCCELLTSASTSSTGFPDPPLLSLKEAVDAEYVRGRIHSADQVVECLRGAAKMCQCPLDSHLVFFVLAGALRTRFMVTHSNDDYEEATALLEMILNPNQPGECSDQLQGLASSLDTELALARSTILENPLYSEVTLSRLRASHLSPSFDERLRPPLADMSAAQARERFNHYSLAESFEEADSFPLRAVNLSSSENMEKYEEISRPRNVRESDTMTIITEKIHHLKGLLSITPPGTDRYNGYLSHLAEWYESKFHSTNDLSDIEESIKYGRLSLDATYPSDPWRINPLGFLRNIFNIAFKRTRKIGYLNDSIALGYEILKSRNSQHAHFHVIQTLVQSLFTREELVGRREDRHEAIRLISMAVDNQHAREPDRFRLSCQWAILARSIGHRTTLLAYESAMSLMQKSLSFAPTVTIQYARLVAMDKICQTMPLEYASYHIGLGRFEEAVETLEKGRTLVWSGMRGLRTPVAQLIEDLPLAKRFAEINQELEALTMTATPGGRPESEHDIAQGRHGTSLFGQLVVKQQKLVEERDVLISEIRCRPGLETFLKAPSFITLRSAALRGPVILVNHCKWRCDIVIIFHDSLPCSIRTAYDFYDRAHKLRDELVEARKHGLDSREYQDALCSVLKGLYVLVGEPVINRLRVLGVPEQSRVWWCPTSVFCSLPLHAMGPIPSSDIPERYFSDLYIPSYTPSLSALIEYRKASPQRSDKPSLLLVARPYDSLPGVKGEIKVIRRALEGRASVTGLVSSEATSSFVVEGLRGSRLAHFACHGVLEAGKPFDASFTLHNGERLTLLDIVRSRLPDAEFAFLSCCHTAEHTEESIADEALHLTAAMQHCGFRSVVGTMWGMVDMDGPDLAKSFYKSLFSSQEGSVPYCERSAHALRNATQRLRRKRGISLERWVNFVHYGA